MIRVQFRIDRLGWQEQTGALRRLTRYDVAVRYGPDMRSDRRAEGRNSARIARSGDHRFISLQREFRVDHQRPWRVGHVDQAIGPPPVRQLCLPGECVGGQRLADQVAQLDFAECAARLLVGQDVLQPKHVAGQAFDIGLRRVDGCQPCLKVAQSFRRSGRIVAQGCADLRFGPVLRIRQGGQTAGQTGLRLRHIPQT